jgi:predicted RNase H-like HicB family nuclease
LVSREARRELKEALALVLGAEASPEAALTIDKH